MSDRIRSEFERLYGSHTPDSYRARLWDWFRTEYSLEFGRPLEDYQPPRNAEELATRHIGDAERIACRLLADTPVSHPIARWWIERVAKEPTFARHLDDFEKQSQEEWLEFLRPESPDWDKRGLHVNTVEDVARLFADLKQDGYAVSGIWDAIVRGRAHPNSTLPLTRALDRATVILATALVDHRLYHEPDSDHTINLYDVATVTTSLAAAVAEFHHAVTSAYASRIQRMELGL